MGADNIERTLGQIVATQQHIIDRLDEFSKALKDHIDDDRIVEKRVDRIEQRLSYASGIAVAMVGFFSLTSEYVLKKIGLK